MVKIINFPKTVFHFTARHQKEAYQLMLFEKDLKRKIKVTVGAAKSDHLMIKRK